MNALFRCTCLGALTLAATPAPIVAETTISIDIGFGIRYVPPARVTVPAGERLRLLAPAVGETSNYIWTKNGRAIAGASEALFVLESVSPDDAGEYSVLLAAPTGFPRPSQSLVLGVGPTDRLLNLSARGIVGPAADAALTAGFVVAASSAGKKIIVRAIGPSLTQFGVANPLRQPVLRIFDGAGRPYTNGYVYLPVVGGLTYERDLADSLARAGAFSLSTGTRDVVTMQPFVPGSYTAQVTSGDATTGSVLLEIYEVP
ncbi:MAG: immunoglobulin domain-containing protein [Verrucomicrobia bacterium]|nr:immunoglobulin domain-containing protein [Verrucomicrobiota bacterium]